MYLSNLEEIYNGVTEEAFQYRLQLQAELIRYLVFVNYLILPPPFYFFFRLHHAKKFCPRKVQCNNTNVVTVAYL